MGTTKDALLAGSVRTVKVLAIEGCPYLIAESDTSAVATAYASLVDYTQVLGGLYCDWEDSQQLNPYEPMTPGGTCTVKVAPDAADTFGKFTHRRIGVETTLTASIDRDDTTIPVASTTSFASSGDAWIGTECVGYTSTDATNLLGCTRGKYSPVWTGAGTRYAHDHRVITDPNSALIKPVVSSVPRIWIGKWAHIYEHRIVNGVLDTVDQAVRVFSGRIADLDDDGQYTSIEIKHALDVIKETSMGRSLWSAKVRDGLYLFQNQAFRIRESDDGGATLSAGQTLTVKDTPTTEDHLQSGYYTLDELYQGLTDWFAIKKAGADLDGEYSFVGVSSTTDGLRTQFKFKLTGVPFPQVVLEMPDSVIKFFGYEPSQFPGVSSLGGAHHYTRRSASSNTTTEYLSSGTPLRAIIDKFSNAGAIEGGLRFEVEDQRGSFVSQFGSLPQPLKVGLISDEGLQWGVFLFDGRILIRAAFDSATNEIIRAVPVVAFGSSDFLSAADLESYTIPIEDNPRDITIRQILVIQAPVSDLIQLLAYSTGTLAHNHATLDNLPYGVGIGIPGGMLGTEFESSVGAIPGAELPLVVVVDKPTTLGELIGGDLQLRRTFLLWKDGTLRFGSWRTPQLADSVANLTESTKAAPGGNEDDHRASSRESDDWVYPVVKIYYDRDLTDIQKENFRGILTIEDSTSVDDAGGEGRTITVKSRNTFAENSQVGASIKDLLSNYLATSPMFTRPGKIVTRSIGPTLYEKLAVGDTVALTDSSVRDPSTGERGLADVAATVVGKRCSRGGAVAGGEQPLDATGTVDLFVPDSSVTATTTAAYVPTADVDETYSSGGFTAGYNSATKTLRCYSYRYSDDGTVIAPALTDAERFVAGSKVRVFERDPDDPAAPQSWDDVVASQSVDNITLTTGLAGFSSSKLYRVVFDTYNDATSSQRDNTFQADPTDNLVLDTVQAYQYASWPSGTNTYLASMNSTIGVELSPDMTADDGSGRDVGTEQAIARLLDMHIDYNSALSLPVIDEVLTNDNDVSGTWMLLQCRSLYLTSEILTGDVWREMSLSPWFRSVDGRLVHLRATLTRAKPGGSTVMDVDRGSIISEATWSTSSTTWDDGTRIEVDCRVKDATGKAWLLVEATLGCETRGMNQAYVSQRLYENTWWIP